MIDLEVGEVGKGGTARPPGHPNIYPFSTVIECFSFRMLIVYRLMATLLNRTDKVYWLSFMPPLSVVVYALHTIASTTL